MKIQGSEAIWWARELGLYLFFRKEGEVRAIAPNGRVPPDVQDDVYFVLDDPYVLANLLAKSDDPALACNRALLWVFEWAVLEGDDLWKAYDALRAMRAYQIRVKQ